MFDSNRGGIIHSWQRAREFVISLAAIFITLTAAVAITQGVHHATALVSHSMPW